MTCIVGYLKDNNIYMGADSAAVSELDITVRNDTKIFLNDEFIIGCTYSFRMIQILRYSFKPPKIPQNMDLHEYMCTKFIDALRSCFIQCGFDVTGEDVGELFLVGIRDRMFIIEDDFQVGEHIDGVYGIGCGGLYALGALKAYSDIKSISPVNAITKTLKIATYYSGGVRPPFTIYDGNKKEFKKYE